MKHFLELLKSLRDFHRGKIEQLKGRYQELDELSNVAVQIADVEAYKSLQKEMKEVFFDYLTAVVVDSVYKLVPHVLIIWLISFKWQSISVPFVDWRISIFAAYLVLYLIFNISQLILRPIKGGLSKLVFFASSIGNRI